MEVIEMPTAVQAKQDGAVPIDIDLAEAYAEQAASEARTDIELGIAPTAPGSGEAQKKALLEAIVYITEEPLSAFQIAGAMGEPLPLIERLLAELVAEHAREDRGLLIRELAGGYQMGTKPEHHEALRQFVKKLNPPLKLSLAALETLAVIAYKQPITAPEIMEIRGVQGAGVMKTLVDRKLVTTAGRKNVVGKPILYKTTKEFLMQFGLASLSELPTLKEFEELRRLALNDVEPEPLPEPLPESVPEPEEGVPPVEPIDEPPREPAAPIEEPPQEERP